MLNEIRQKQKNKSLYNSFNMRNRIVRFTEVDLWLPRVTGHIVSVWIDEKVLGVLMVAQQCKCIQCY